MPLNVHAPAVVLVLTVASTAMAIGGRREGGRPGRPVVRRRIYDGGEVQGSGTRKPRPARERIYSECPSRPAAGDGLHGKGEVQGAGARRPRPARERVYSECPSRPAAGDGLHDGGEVQGAGARRPRPARRVYNECPNRLAAGDGLHGGPSAARGTEPPAEEEEGRLWAEDAGLGVQDPRVPMAIPQTKVSVSFHLFPSAFRPE